MRHESVKVPGRKPCHFIRLWLALILKEYWKIALYYGPKMNANLRLDFAALCHFFLYVHIYCFAGLESRKSLIVGMIVCPRDISATCVVSGKIVTLDAERRPRSPEFPPPFKLNISAICSIRTPSASPWMKNIGALAALNLSAPKSYGFTAAALR